MSKHLAFPIAVTSRGLSTVDHDSDADVAQSVRLLLNTEQGERRSVPDYGLPDPLFDLEAQEDDISEAIGEWEERADFDELDLTTLKNGDPDGV